LSLSFSDISKLEVTEISPGASSIKLFDSIRFAKFIARCDVSFDTKDCACATSTMLTENKIAETGIISAKKMVRNLCTHFVHSVMPLRSHKSIIILLLLDRAKHQKTRTRRVSTFIKSNDFLKSERLSADWASASYNFNFFCG